MHLPLMLSFSCCIFLFGRDSFINHHATERFLHIFSSSLNASGCQLARRTWPSWQWPSYILLVFIPCPLDNEHSTAHEKYGKWEEHQHVSPNKAFRAKPWGLNYFHAHWEFASGWRRRWDSWWWDEIVGDELGIWVGQIVHRLDM